MGFVIFFKVCFNVRVRLHSEHSLHLQRRGSWLFTLLLTSACSPKAAKGREGPSRSQQGTWQRGRCQNHRVLGINSSKIWMHSFLTIEWMGLFSPSFWWTNLVLCWSVQEHSSVKIFGVEYKCAPVNRIWECDVGLEFTTAGSSQGQPVEMSGDVYQKEECFCLAQDKNIVLCVCVSVH